MKRKHNYPLLGKFFIIVPIVCSILSVTNSANANRIRVVGSSTVFPFVAVAAEEFSRATSHDSPVIESTGTGGGFNLFCGKSTKNSPVINSASRTIKKKELSQCNENNVNNVMELMLGYDGLAVANNADGPVFTLTPEHMHSAVAYHVIKDGAVVKNTAKRWNDISPELPDVPITVYGPPTTSGTRDAFNELVMIPVCDRAAAMLVAYPDKKKRHAACTLMREDGRFIDSTENDNLIIQKLRANPSALGIFGYSFLEQNNTAIRGASINGVMPEYDNIAGGKYPLIRPLYIYVNAENSDNYPGLSSFLDELFSENAIGEDGYLTYKGLIPPSEKEYDNNLGKLSRIKH